MRAILYATIFSSALIASVLFSGFSTVSAASWDAGRIIDDAIFTDKKSMSVSNVQSFLNSKDSTCLKNYTTPKPLGSGNYGGNVSAAQAIYDVSQLYGISPKVILVTLEKEQGLVTRSDCPSWRYRSALGYDCNDTTPCQSEGYGFSTQLYQGARHFRGFYDQNSGWFIPYTPGTRYIQYNPSASCGGSSVYIENRATASLYSYTPYQPNSATRAASPGVEVNCGAYGNINFWRYYRSWFGTTYGDPLKRTPFKGDWDGNGTDTIGIKLGAQYYLDNNNDGVGDTNFGIGRNSDSVIVGDWDGDGADEVGLRRGSNFYLDTDSDGTAEISFGIGRSTDQLIIGDWDGNGTDNIGLKRGNMYYLDTNNDNYADIYVGIGRPTDQVIIGDWDGNGTDNIGLKRGNMYYLDTNNNNYADIYYGIGRATDKVKVGDWDGNGTDNIGLKRGNMYYLDTDNTRLADIYVGIGRDTDALTVGDWDGDDRDEIGLQRGNYYYFDTDNDGTAEISFSADYY